MKSFWNDLDAFAYVVGFFGGFALLIWIPINAFPTGTWESEEQLLTMSFRFICVACMLSQLYRLHQLRISLGWFEDRNLMKKDEKIEELENKIETQKSQIESLTRITLGQRARIKEIEKLKQDK